MKEEIIEPTFDKGNDLIARFMGARWRTWEDNKAPLYRFDEPIGKQYAFHHTELQYHTSWDWLMPALHKWDNLNIESDEYTLLCDTLDDLIICYEIEGVYSHFIECLHWYNTAHPTKIEKT